MKTHNSSHSTADSLDLVSQHKRTETTYAGSTTHAGSNHSEKNCLQFYYDKKDKNQLCDRVILII